MTIFCFSNKKTMASKNIVKKLMTIFSDFFQETKNFCNSYWMRIERCQLQMFFQDRCSWCSRPEGLQIYQKETSTQVFAVKFMNFFGFLQSTFGGCIWIDLDFLVLHEHLLHFHNSYIYVAWINNAPATRSIGMKFDFLQRQVLETYCKFLIC